MKKKMRKWLGILLVAVMVFSIDVYAGITASAAKSPEITQVNLTEVPDVCVVGGTVSVYSYTDSDNHYQAEGHWYIFDRSARGWSNLADGEVFTDGETYWFYLKISPNAGYRFSDSAKVFVNGSEWTDDLGGMTDGSYLCAEKHVSFGDPIEDLSGLSDVIREPEIGDSFSKVSMLDPKTGSYTVELTWKDEDGKDSGTFENGKKYSLSITLIAEPGYYFSEDFAIQVGDEQISFKNSIKARVNAEYEKSFKTKISEAEITLPKAEVGKVLQPGEFEISVASGAPYTVTGTWEDASRYPITAAETVEDGKAYTLSVKIEPVPGYEFDTPFLVTVDGLTRNVRHEGGEHANFDVYYSLRESIDRIELSGVELPDVGQSPVSKESIKVPAGVNYSVSFVKLVNNKTYTEESVCRDGQNYTLQIGLQANAGYEFASGLDLFVDGERAEGSVSADGANAGIYFTVSFAEVIPEVRLDNMPTMKVGEVAQTNVTVPDGAVYEVLHCQWMVWNNVSNSFESFSGVFEANKVYSIEVMIEATDGYRFDSEATAYYVNGSPAALKQFGLPYAYYSQEYAEGLKEIDRVEFTVEEPVMGHHTSVGPNISVNEGAHYKAAGSSWIRGRRDVYTMSTDEIFSLSNSYGININMVADEGYAFAADLTVVINGVVVEKINGSIGTKTASVAHFFQSSCAHDYSEWEAETEEMHFRKCSICGYKETAAHTYDAASGLICTVCGYQQAEEQNRFPLWGLIAIFGAVVIAGSAVIVISRNLKKKRAANKD